MSEERKEQINEAGKAMVEEAYSKAADEIYANAGKKEKRKLFKREKKTAEPIAEAEQNVSDADENKAWYQKNKKAIVISIIVLVVLIIACVAGLIAYHSYYKSLTRGVLLYQDDGNMMSVKMFEDPIYSQQWNSWNFNDEDTDNNSNPGAVTTDGKYLYFAMNANGAAFDLYFAKIGSKESVLIASGVDDYEIASKGEIYYTQNNALYRYLVKDGAIQHICNEAKWFCLNDKKSEMLILSNSNVLSTLKLAQVGSLTTLEEGVVALVEASDDFETVVYEKADGLYMLTKGEEKTLITNACEEYHVYNIDGKCEVYYLTAERGLYYFKAGADESNLVTANVCKLLGTDNEAAMCFAAIGPNPEQSSYVLVEGGKTIEMKDVQLIIRGEEIFYDTADKKVYFVGVTNAGDAVGTLYSMGYQLLDKGKVEVAANSVISIEYVDGNRLYTGVDAGNGGIDLYCDNVLVANNIVSGSVQETADGKDIIFRYRASDAEGDSLLAVYDGTGIAEVGSCVGEFCCAVTAKEIYLMQYGTEGYDLLKYNGHKLKTVMENVDRYHYLFY